MGFYGNKWMQESAQSKMDLIESELYTIESVVYNEYYNYKQLLENASGSDIALLEAKVEVLYEVSIADIKQKIKELWVRFKNFIKEIINQIDYKRIEDKVKNALKKVKELARKAEAKGINNPTKEDSNLYTFAYAYEVDEEQIDISKFGSKYGSIDLSPYNVEKKINEVLDKIEDTDLNIKNDELSDILDEFNNYISEIVNSSDSFIKFISKLNINREQKISHDNFRSAIDACEKNTKILLGHLDSINIYIYRGRNESEHIESTINKKIKNSNLEYDKILLKISSDAIKLFSIYTKEMIRINNILTQNIMHCINNINSIATIIKSEL